MISRVRESRNPKKVIRVTLMESYGEIGRVPVNLFCIKFCHIVKHYVPKPVAENEVRLCSKNLSQKFAFILDENSRRKMITHDGNILLLSIFCTVVYLWHKFRRLQNLHRCLFLHRIAKEQRQHI